MAYLLRILFIHNPDICLLIPSVCHQYAPLTFRHVRRIEKGDYESRHVTPSTGRVWYFKIFRKYLDKFQVSLKPNNNNAHFTYRSKCIYDNNSLNSSYNGKCFRQVVYRKSKLILCALNFFRKSCHLWDNMEKCGKPKQARENKIIRPGPFACWINKATDTHYEFVMLIAFPLEQCFRESTLLLRFYARYIF
jgi:hypothetical protein